MTLRPAATSVDQSAATASGMALPISAATLLPRLAAEIDQVLDPLLPTGTRCALVDVANHANVGDAAIFLGEEAYLKARGVRIFYRCDIAAYSRQRLAETLHPGDVILFTGGGTIGDMWVRNVRLREDVIASFPTHRIIQLPESIHFRDREKLLRTKIVFQTHPNLTVLARDRDTFELLQQEFGVDTGLCPDMAFKLGTLSRPQEAETDLVWLGRQDPEAAGFDIPDSGRVGVKADWATERPSSLARVNRFLTRQQRSHPRKLRYLSDVIQHTYVPLAWQRLKRGCRLLSRGKVVVTDRLHGHILCLLLGIPHVALDNNYGKLKRFLETWTGRCELSHRATSPAEALEIAIGLADRASHEPPQSTEEVGP